MQLGPIIDNAGPSLRLLIKGFQGSGTTSFNLTLSVDLSTK
jgi:hypothetical protein